MKIYTKTGDKGTTMLFGGGRVPKHHIRIEAYGTVDELNSYLGLIADHLNLEHAKTVNKEIQDRLFTVGSVLARDPEKSVEVPDLKESDVELLEKEMDKMNEELPALTNFILPGGNITSSHCQVARCICRRAERRSTHLSEIQEGTVPEIVIRYLNRLSDYLFVLARFVSFKAGNEEIIWNPRK